MGPLFSASLLLIAAFLVALVSFVVARIFLPSRRAFAMAIVIVGFGAAGGAASALALAPFFAGETLTSTPAVIGYLGTLLVSAVVFASLGAWGYLKWIRQSNNAIDSDTYSAPLRAPNSAGHRER